MKSQRAKRSQDLIIWQKTHQLVLRIYRYTEAFPITEMFGLTSQFRRAAVSVQANIAEGFKKRINPDKLKFFNIAQGSPEECRYRYYLILSNDLGFGEIHRFKRKLEKSVSCFKHTFIRFWLLTPEF
jgi:four helix bundle protein